MLKTHLVFPQDNKKLADEIAKLTIISGWHSSLAEASLWAREGGGEAPDLFLINGGACFQQGNNTPVKIIEDLEGIKSCRKKSRIVLLLPEKYSADYQLIMKLLKLHIYDFWFIDSFDLKDIQNFLFCIRTGDEAEEYLQKFEKKRFGNGKPEHTGSPRLASLLKPYYVKSNILAFWSEDNSALNYAMAVLTSMTLAEQGFKVALIESITCTPQLAGSMSICHPYFNTSHALSMFTQKNNDFIRKCLFNTEKYLNDPHTPDRETDLRHCPGSLFFLPDGKRNDNIPDEEMKTNWREFITELARIVIFEEDFNFLIIVCNGKTTFSDTVLKEIAYLRFITVSMLPGSVAYGLNQLANNDERVHVIGSRYLKFLADEIKGITGTSLLYPPDSFEKEFLNFVYSKDYRKIGQDARNFINQLVEIMGVKIEPVTKKWRSFIKV